MKRWSISINKSSNQGGLYTCIYLYTISYPFISMAVAWLAQTCATQATDIESILESHIL